MDCIFCMIAEGKIPSKKLYEDELIYSFYDINPQAKVHVLVIPKNHISSVDSIVGDHTENGEVVHGNSKIISYIFEKIPMLATKAGIKNGYRVITNCGEDGCQSVKHLHFHILGGEKLSERMA